VFWQVLALALIGEQLPAVLLVPLGMLVAASTVVMMGVDGFAVD